MTKALPLNARALALSIIAALFLSACGENTEGAATASDTAEIAALETDVAVGSEDAPVTIIEYASMTCGHCATFHTETYPQVKEKYIETGKVRYILREFPLDQFAAAAFVTAHCIGDGKYYAAIDLLFEEQSTWIAARPENRKDALASIARKAGVGRAQFDSCLEDESLYERVKKVQESGRDLGIRSTPTFFVNGKKYSGALPFERFDEILSPLLPAE